VDSSITGRVFMVKVKVLRLDSRYSQRSSGTEITPVNPAGIVLGQARIDEVLRTEFVWFSRWLHDDDNTKDSSSALNRHRQPGDSLVVSNREDFIKLKLHARLAACRPASLRMLQIIIHRNICVQGCFNRSSMWNLAV